MHPFSARLSTVARLLECTPESIDLLVEELRRSGLIAALSAAVSGVPQFSNAQFKDIDNFSLFRTLLYVVTRLQRPTVFLETGVLNGFSSAFILQALADNRHGRLVSIDLPSLDLRFLSQGTAKLPEGKDPGWAIPPHLRRQHDLRTGRSEQLLPEFLVSNGAPDIFLHDSDHSYAHMIMEISIVWAHMKVGLILADNVEQNRAFADFCSGVDRPSTIVSSYDDASRRWQHGLIIR